MILLGEITTFPSEKERQKGLREEGVSGSYSFHNGLENVYQK